jgi:hypothetical protein
MNYIRDNYGRIVQSRDMMRLLGLRPGAHLPDGGMEERTIQGVRVWVTHIVHHPDEHPSRDRRRGPRPHRIMCACSVCGKAVPFGRLFQHGAVHRADDSAVGRYNEWRTT